MKKFLFIFSCLTFVSYYGQFDFDDQLPENKNNAYTEDIIDDVYGITIYEPLNLGLSPDSVRMENGYAVNNWKEDFYTNGQLLHKGYYIDGQLKIYKNYYPDGTLERDFKNIDGFRSKSALYYSNGNIKSEITYLNGAPILWIDYFDNGNMEYYEEYNKNLLYHLAKKSFYKTGQIESMLEITSKKKLHFLFYEYHKNGKTKIEGTLKYDMNMYDYYKTGTWIHFNEVGKETKHETYYDGKVIKSKDF